MQPVFRDYDQKALDDAYDQAVYALNRDQLPNAATSPPRRHARRLGEPPARLAYGPGPSEQLDVYPTRRSHIHVFVHGGAWRAGRARKSRCCRRDVRRRRRALTSRSTSYNAPDCGGDLFVMADQVRRAIAWVYRKRSAFRRRRGAHLRFGHVLRRAPRGRGRDHRLGTLRNAREPGQGLRAVQRNVRPARAAPVQAQRVRSLQRRDGERAIAAAASRAHQRADHRWLYGSLETPEFQRQTREFAAALERAGRRSS